MIERIRQDTGGMPPFARVAGLGTRRPLTCFFFVAYLLAVVAATFSPSQPGAEIRWTEVVCVLCGETSLADGFANIALFVPLGVALRLLGYGRRRALLCAASLSLGVELAQFAIPGRDPNLGDFIFNTLGAVLGDSIVAWAPRLARPGVRVASRLSLLAGVAAGAVFALCGFLLTASLPQTTYFGGSTYLQTSSMPLRLGGNADTKEHFQGRIDEVRIYRRERTPSEIQTDMNVPVAAARQSPDLVAAYSFDEGAGLVLRDMSGHGNTGEILGATWTNHGRFGGALVFDGPGDVVVIPHDPSLDLTTAMTLEAWIYPAAAQRGWRPILQKEFDAYFLLASSKAGARKPGGGGTFGSSTEIVRASAVAPIDAWTHVALTYNGAVLELYINGRLAERRLRWYPGRVLDARLGGLAIPAGMSDESRRLRERILSGAPISVQAMAAPPAPRQVPLVTLHDQFRNEILFLGAHEDDLIFRVRTRAAAAGLDSPAIRARGVLHGLTPGSDMAVTLSRDGRGYCVDVNNRSTCGLGFTLGMGWAFFIYSQVPPGWPHIGLNALWMASLLFPFGFWLRRRWESLLGLLVLAVGLVLPCTIGNLSVTPTEVGAAIIGLLAGCACALRVTGSNLSADGVMVGTAGGGQEGGGPPDRLRSIFAGHEKVPSRGPIGTN